MILKNDLVTVKIDNLGAEISEIKYLDEVISHDKNKEFWGRNAPVLFPTVGAIKEDTYVYEDQVYHLPQHGFARDQEFSIIDQGDDYVVYELTHSPETLKVYPFEFSLKIKYSLVGNKLTTTYDITNPSDKQMLYSIGAHPAFRIDMNDDYKVVMDNAGTSYNLVGPFIGTPSRYDQVMLNCDIETFKDGALIYQPTANKQIKILKADQDYITMDFNDFELMGVWAPEGKNSPFVCLEPWNGIADFNTRKDNELTNKDLIRTLKASQSETFSFTITIY